MIYFSALLPLVLVLTIVLQAQARECPEMTSCANCINLKKNCSWSKIKFVCKSGAGTDSVVDLVGCPQMAQQQGVFPAIKDKSAAGVITEIVDAEFTRIEHHIFDGESSSKTSGRHWSATWTKDNPKSKLLLDNTDSHIMLYQDGKTGKTVWDSAAYSKLDVKNMCAVAIALGNADKVTMGAYVVQSPFGSPACINHFTMGTGSCYPLGVDPPTEALGEKCGDGSGDLIGVVDQEVLTA